MMTDRSCSAAAQAFVPAQIAPTSPTASLVMPPVIIVVSGKRFAGKDEVGKHIARIVTSLGYSVAVTSFADAVKRAAASTHGLDYVRLCNDRNYKEKHRAKLIEVGMAGRAADPNHWVDLTWQRHCTQEVVVVTDWRFPNEAHYLDELEAKVICVRVIASKSARRARGWVYDRFVDNSASETSLDVLDDVWHWTGDLHYIFNSEQNNIECLVECVETMLKRAGFVDKQ